MRGDANQLLFISEDSDLSFSSSKFYSFSVNWNSLIQISSSSNNANNIIKINNCSFSRIYQNMSNLSISNPIFSVINSNLQMNITNCRFSSNLIGIFTISNKNILIFVCSLKFISTSKYHRSH